MINGKLLCLRNDNAANVLWVNTKLWSQFFPGKSPPTTWAAVRCGWPGACERPIPATTSVSSGSPGTRRHTCGVTSARSTKRSASRCFSTTPSSPNCTTIAHLIDSARGAFTKDGPFTTAWVNDKTAQHMVMDIGAIWQGGAIYPSGSGSEGPGTNVMEAYPPPLATNGAHVTGSIGGGLWLVVVAHQASEGRRSSGRVHGDQPEDPGEPQGDAGSSGLCAGPGHGG